ncbi:MAG: hypothetical protein ACRDRL_27610 [Sciscionella sp.]
MSRAVRGPGRPSRQGDLRLAAGQHPKTVSERLGHATVSITMDVYSHAVPSLQREAATLIGSTIHDAA